MKTSIDQKNNLKIDYKLEIPKEISYKIKTNVAWKDFIESCMKKLEPAMNLPFDEYNGHISKN